MFIRRKGTILCRVSGSKQYSRDLPQGGLEIPCVLLFSGTDGDVVKVKRVLEKSAYDSEPKKASGLKEETNDENPNMEKRRRIDLEDCWVKCGAIILTIADKQLLINGHELHDDHVTASQALLSEQFPYFSGFRCTLIQHSFNGWKDNYKNLSLQRKPLDYCEYSWK